MQSRRAGAKQCPWRSLLRAVGFGGCGCFVVLGNCLVGSGDGGGEVVLLNKKEEETEGRGEWRRTKGGHTGRQRTDKYTRAKAEGGRDRWTSEGDKRKEKREEKKMGNKKWLKLLQRKKKKRARRQLG